MSTTTNNPSLNFKFGLQTDLGKVSLTPGTIYVTTDERTMWVDLPVGDETKRFRLGDFISYKNKTELKNDYQNWNSSTLAYIEDTNTLAKFDGTKWVDINNFNLIQSLDARVGYEEIKDEEGSVTSEATGLFKKIKDEEDRATAKEVDLESSIGSLADRTSDLEIKVGSDKVGDKEATGLYKLIADEVARATKAESDINDEIGDKDKNSGIEATTLWAAIEEINKDISDEANDRESADEVLREDLTKYIEASFAAADAMTFKGVITTIADLPTGEADAEGNNKILVNAGDTYKIGAMIASSATPEEHGVWYIGDLIIAKADQSEEDVKYSGGWYHISSGFEDDYTSYLDINDAEDTIILKDGADQSRGSITFKVPEGGSSSLNVNVSKDSTTDRSQNSTVSINLVWGTF